ncbi:E3 ubiquitin-protein ligase Topors-like [Eublepharis macularius]|uniref:RING-type E3 ubiquitin transferase n=1 Tax=Eublepharis macularius TaxID=481883 RepID=A0AA97L5N5_EUBMA|nr:E3 ubiquitin-protein ligase Topors-like [Eublepharis macularius]
MDFAEEGKSDGDIMKSSRRESKSKFGFKSTSRGSSAKTVALDTSKYSKCAICLERIQDATYLNPCNHRFCFTCIQNWSRKKVICPLCKQRFHSFFHIVNSKSKFCEYVLPLSNDSFPHSESRRDQTLTSSQRSMSPPDDGIVNDEIRGTLNQTEKDIYQLMRQFAVTKRPANIDVITLGKFKTQAVIQFRRALYHAGILVQKAHNPDVYQTASAEYFRRNPGSFDRLIPWLKRELRVLCGNQRSLIHTLQNFILNNMTQRDLESKEFEDLLRPHLRHFTNHFLHEFTSFVQSPFTIKRYDWNALYECPVLPKEDCDSFISSTTSEDERSQLLDNDQASPLDSNLDGGNLGCSHSSSEKDVFSVAEGTQYPNEEEKNLEDVTSCGTEKDEHSSDNLIQNQPIELPPNSTVQPSSLHNQALPCKNKNEEIEERHPVETYSSKNMEPFEDASNVLASGDCNVSNFSCGDAVAISNRQNVSKGETIKFPSSEKQAGRDRQAGRKSEFKKGGSRNTECYWEERRGGQSRAGSQHERMQNANYCNARERRPRIDGGKSRTKYDSLQHKNKMILPFKSENAVAGHISKPKSHHFRKLRSKDYDNLRKSLSSEPSWRYLYYKQDYERYRYEELLRQKAGKPRFYHPNMLTGSKGRSYFSPENKTSLYQESLAKGWNYSEIGRSTGRPKGRFVAAGQERGSNRKLGGKRRHRSHHMETGYSKGGARYFQNYVSC